MCVWAADCDEAQNFADQLLLHCCCCCSSLPPLFTSHTGEALPLDQAEILAVGPRGHSFEARLYAENVHRNFLPGEQSRVWMVRGVSVSLCV